MNTIMTKVLIIIVLALVGSLGNAASVQAKDPIGLLAVRILAA